MLLSRILCSCVLSLFGLASCMTGLAMEREMETGESVVLVTGGLADSGQEHAHAGDLGFDLAFAGRMVSKHPFPEIQGQNSIGLEPMRGRFGSRLSFGELLDCGFRGGDVPSQGPCRYRVAYASAEESSRRGRDALGVAIPVGNAQIDFSYTSSGPFFEKPVADHRVNQRTQKMLLIGVAFRF